ncbi:MAG: flagellar hook-length control protein FliK [Syntrophobacteraceae bacterium]
MQSGQVNAAPLLASYLGSENEKIGQTIAQGDFSGELQKLMPVPAKGAGSSARNNWAKPETAAAANWGSKASAGETPAGAETKSSTVPSTQEPKGATDSRTKISEIKSKAKKELNLMVSNPAIAQTVLGDLQYPAQTKKAFEGMQNKDGQISIKDLRSLLDTQASTGSQARGQVPAEHARALVESIIDRGSGTNPKESAYAGTLQSSVQLKTEGSYSPSEFRGLLDKVLQQANTSQGQSGDPGSQPGLATTAEGLKRGQAETLVGTVLPSFISADHENDSPRQILAGNPSGQTSEAQSAMVRDVRENSVETVSDYLKSEEQLNAAKVASGGEDSEGAALVTEAGIKGGGPGGASTIASSALPSAQQETSGIPVEALDPVLKYFDASIVSESPQQTEVNTAPTPAPGAPSEASAAQAQNMASPVKGAEKQAEGPRGTLSSWRLAQDIAEQAEAALMKTAASEPASSDSSFDGNPQQTAVPSPEIQANAEASVTTIDSEQIPADPSVLGTGSDSGLSVDASAMAAMAMDGSKVAESYTALSGLDTAILSKQIEKQLGSTNFATENAVFQTSASSFQGSGVNLPRMENSAQSGLTYLDAYQSAELAQDSREQVTGGVAKHLVLEMEPDELGKISIKVGAKKGEISVEALTQSEPARQALMRHSPELRQGLQDQGLVLEKFMVDVDREKSGGGNYPGGNSPKEKTPPVSKTGKTAGIQAAAEPAYIGKTDGQSRISIFA